MTLTQSRQAAMEISLLLPLLEANDIRLIGIGLEDIGVVDFLKGEFFSGELYIDSKKSSYAALGFRRFNICTLIMSMFTRSTWTAISKGREQHTRSDIRGDALQNGGLLIVKKGGQEILLSYRQQNPADHVPNEEILKALGINTPNSENPDFQNQKS